MFFLRIAGDDATHVVALESGMAILAAQETACHRRIGYETDTVLRQKGITSASHLRSMMEYSLCTAATGVTA